MTVIIFKNLELLVGLHICHFQPFPNGTGYETPEEKQAAAPIDDADAAVLESMYNVASYRTDFHQQRVTGVAQQVSGYESGVDVGKVDGQALPMCRFFSNSTELPEGKLKAVN